MSKWEEAYTALVRVENQLQWDPFGRQYSDRELRLTRTFRPVLKRLVDAVVVLRMLEYVEER